MILAEPIWSGPRPELDDLADHLLAQLKPELEPGERLVWASEPGRSPVGQPPSAGKALVLTALGFVGLGIALVGVRWLVGPQGDRVAELAAVSFVLAFLTVGLLVVGGLLQMIKALCFPGDRRRPLYGLTDRRAIFLTPVAGTKAVQVQSIPRGSIRPESIRRVQRPDGSGDLLFLPDLARPNGFHGVANVRAVDLLLRRHSLSPETHEEPF